MIKLVAEIGCNHQGSFELAKELSKIYATEANADIIKFQKRNPKELLSEQQYNQPHPNPHNSFGSTYGEHREKLEFTLQQHKELKSYIESFGKVYSTSVWDVTSAEEIASLNPELIKVPSAKNTNFDVLKVLKEQYQGDIHISLGMTTKDEIRSIIDFMKDHGDRLVIYACTSGYPISHDEACLLEILSLKKEYQGYVKDIGYSGHHLGIALDIAAATLLDNKGYIERHVTGYGGRVWKGTDQSASLEPDGFKKLKRDLIALNSAYKYKDVEILPVEVEQRKKLK